MNRKVTFLLTLLFLGCFRNVEAQTSCPSNIDFELGSFSLWSCYTGIYISSATPTTWTLTPTPVAGRHTITSGTGTDPYGFFPVVAPGGGSYSAKLGNNVIGALAEKATYTLTVPSTSGVWSLIYRYAVVLENPGHSPSQQPKMTVAAYDLSSGSSLVPCTNYTYVSSGSVPGFSLSAVGGDVYYKPWTYGNMKFPGLAGHSVMVDFEAFDCAATGHFGYGYIDMSCGFFANSIIGCASGSTVLSGPDGFASYAWYDSATFTTLYGSSEIITVTAPTVTTTYAVILTPYTGYGCPDTLYTQVIPSTLVVNRSHDTSICSGSSVTLTPGATSASMPLTYSWAPSTGLSCTTCGTVTATPTSSTIYSCTVTDASLCTKTVTINVTVVPTPCTIAGASSVCPLATTTLTDCATGGVWTISPSGLASIGSSSGVVTGISSGTATVTYTTGGICRTSTTITVSPSPPAISPSPVHVCEGSTTTVTDASSGGSWSVTPSGVYATIGSATGLVTGIFHGSPSTITYTATTGCIATAPLTVDATPSGITGIPTVCLGGTQSLTDPTPGGTWSASPTTTVTVNPLTGVVTGVGLGTGTVTYTLTSTGCKTMTTVNVVAPPSAISGPTNVCIGSTGVSYTDPTIGGAWSISNPSIAYIDPSLGTLSISTTGVDTIYYTSYVTGCSSSLVVTINPNPVVTGIPAVCVGATTTLSASVPVTWSSSDTTKATVNSSGLITGISSGTVNITCTSIYGCSTVTPVLVNPLPLPISGPTSLCVGTCVTLTDGTSGGSFSTAPGTWASVTPAGLVCGSANGVEVITYTSGSTGCSRTYPVTVNTSPSPITGVMSVCVGNTTSLSDLVTGGTWSATPTAVGTIGSTTGVLTALTSGTVTVTYSLGASCNVSAVVTVNPLPGAISPSAPSVCVGGTLTLTDPPGPGTWSSSCPGTLTIGSTSGIVSGIGSGTCIVTYTFGATGCSITKNVTVNPNPLPITPPSPAVCIGSTLPMGDPTGGGSWSSVTPAVGSIVASSGVATGVSAGTTTIKYTLPTGCSTSTVLTVNPLPSLYTITGGGAFCAGGSGVSIGLSGSTVGISYQLYLGASAIGSAVTGTGSAISFGLQTTGGSYTVVATNPATGCSRTMTGTAVITVNPLPAPIVGPSAVCVASSITLTDATPIGTWTSSVPAAATCTPGPSTTTTVTGHTNGLSTVIKYTLPTGCFVTTTVTVSPSPGPILGGTSVCVGACVTLSDTVFGGIWSTSSGTATAGSSSGSVCGISAGSAVITYSLGTGCQRYDTMTITPAPLPITGTRSICSGDLDTFRDATPGGSWLVDPASASLGTISSTSGIFTSAGGTSTGVATISYAASGGTGCAVTYLLTINPIPTPIIGSSQVCQGSCTALSDTFPTGGTWTVTPTTTASIGSTTGSLCGILPGTATVKYSAAGCSTTKLVTVNALPSVITGTARVCEGATTTLSSSPGTGTWSAATSAVTVTPGPSATTLVTGGSIVGTTTTTVTYTLPTGCARTTTVTVNVTPQPISGIASVCVGHTTVLTDATPGGSWSTSSSSIAPVTSTGVVTGSTAGTATITYTLGSCIATYPVTVVAPPGPITGLPTVCVGGTITMADATPGGTWSTSLPAMATINPSTGVLTGISSGTVIISYGGASGCYAPAMTVVVEPISPIQGTPVVCQGQTTHLVDTTLGGTWISMNPTVASVNPVSGVVTGGILSGPGADTATIVYHLSTGCSASIVVTVNPAPTIAGPRQVCAGSVIVCGPGTPAGGTWSSSNTAAATISSTSGALTGIAPGVTNVCYTTSSTGCPVCETVTVNTVPLPIMGPNSICDSTSITLVDPTVGGTWSSTAPAIAAVGSSTGIVTGYVLGGSATISYTLPATGCAATKTVTVTAPPPAPTGTLNICQGQTTTLTDAAGSGTWASSAVAVATVNPVTGDVYGANPGTAAITFSLGAGCTSPAVIVTVNATPGAITPYISNLCIGSTVTFAGTPPARGIWLSGDTTIGTIDSFTGVATGLATGSAVITYELPSGCFTTAILNVSGAVSPITGINSVCVGLTTSLSDATAGGTWSSSLPTIGSIDPVSGVVTGISTGTTTISYNTGSVCIPTMVVSVNPVPGPISGAGNVCQGSTISLSDATSGGTWSSLDPGHATVSSTGVVTGVPGSGISGPYPVNIAYMLGAGCQAMTTVVVNPQPAAITGYTNNVCVGQAITLSDASAGTWSSSDTSIATVDIYGDVSGVIRGNVNISYTNSYSCSVTYPVTVNTMPTPITGNFNVCLGGTSTLHDAVPGGTWTSLSPSLASVGSSSGVVTGHILGSTTIVYSDTGNCIVTQVVNVVPLPNIYTVTGGGNHCSFDTGVHIGLSGSSLGVNYLIYRGATAVGVVHGTGGPLDLGLYTVDSIYTVTGTNAATGCSVNMTGSATVHTIRSVTPSVSLNTTPSATVCAGTSVTITAVPVNGGSSPQYTWSINSHPVALTNSYTYIPANGDTVTVSMTSNAVCPDPATVKQHVVMTVNPFANPSLSLSVSPSDTVCQGTLVSVNAAPSYGGTAPVYLWYKNGAPMTGSGPSFSYVPHNGDILYATMASNYPCRLSSLDTSAPISITVDTPVYPVVSIVANPGFDISLGQPDTLKAIVSNAVTPTYQWYVNGIPVPGATTNTFVSSSFSYPKEDSVSCAVTSYGICPITSHQWLYIRVHSVGVQQIYTGVSDINVLPNPNKGEFTVKGQLGTITDEDVTLEMTDVLGQVIYKNKITARAGKLNEQVKLRGNIANGMYMLSVRSETDNKVFHVVIEQ